MTNHRTITRNSDFARAYRRGKSYVHAHVVLYVNKNRQKHMRIGFTATKKIGKAVVRNRARRVMKAALASVIDAQTMQKYGVDIVLVARGATPKIKSTKLEAALNVLFKKAGIETIKERGELLNGVQAPGAKAIEQSELAKQTDT